MAKAMFLMTKYESSILPRLLAPLLAGLLVSAAYHSNAQADTAAATYVIADQDGYGMLDCLIQKSDCGKIVADSWCEAHGHGPARAFGRAEDITASTETKTPRQSAESGAALVACNE